jgi:hypothetical protein
VPTKRPIKDDLTKALDAVDWAKIDAMTDREIEEAVRSDPDNPLLTDEQLRRLRHASPRQPSKPTAAE